MTDAFWFGFACGISVLVAINVAGWILVFWVRPNHAPSGEVPRSATPRMCAAGFAVGEHDPAGVWRAMYDAATEEEDS